MIGLLGVGLILTMAIFYLLLETERLLNGK